MDERLELRVDKNTEDIHQLTRNIDKLVLNMEHSETDRKKDMEVIKDAVSKIGTLSDKMSVLASVQETTNQTKEDLRVARHDINEVKNAQLAIPVMAEKIVKLETKMEHMETLRDQFRGGAAVLSTGAKIFYSFLSIGGFSLLLLALKYFFNIDVGVASE